MTNSSFNKTLGTVLMVIGFVLLLVGILGVQDILPIDQPWCRLMALFASVPVAIGASIRFQKR